MYGTTTVSNGTLRQCLAFVDLLQETCVFNAVDSAATKSVHTVNLGYGGDMHSLDPPPIGEVWGLSS